MMVSKIQKWGNSLALRIPKPYADEIGLDDGSSVELQVVNGELHIVRVRRTEYDLDSLLEMVTDDNRHGEIASANPLGNEAW